MVANNNGTSFTKRVDAGAAASALPDPAETAQPICHYIQSRVQQFYAHPADTRHHHHHAPSAITVEYLPKSEYHQFAAALKIKITGDSGDHGKNMVDCWPVVSEMNIAARKRPDYSHDIVYLVPLGKVDSAQAIHTQLEELTGKLAAYEMKHPHHHPAPAPSTQLDPIEQKKHAEQLYNEAYHTVSGKYPGQGVGVTG